MLQEVYPWTRFAERRKRRRLTYEASKLSSSDTHSTSLVLRALYEDEIRSRTLPQYNATNAQEDQNKSYLSEHVLKSFEA